MFPISKLQIEIEMLDDYAPSGYWGARLRGGYGWMLKEGLCNHRELTDCRVCERFETCEYPKLFEPMQTVEASKLCDAPLKHKTHLPRPFVIEPPAFFQQPPKRGERVSFAFTFCGPLCHQLEYPVLAFGVFGKQGLWGQQQHRARFRIVGVSDSLNEGQAIFQGGQFGQAVIRQATDIVRANRWGQPPSQLQINFLTPTRIENEKARQRDPQSGTLALFSDFYDLIYNLANRVGGLWQLYGQEWAGQASFYRWREQLLKASRHIKTVENQLTMFRLNRHSNRQQQDLWMDGFVGQMTFVGDFAPFEELLKIGEIVHLGQQTTFGLGRYEIRAHND